VTGRTHSYREDLRRIDERGGVGAKFGEEIGRTEQNEEGGNRAGGTRYEPEEEEGQGDHDEPPVCITRRPIRSIVQAARK